MLGETATERGAHGKSGHPAADLQHSGRVIARRQRQSGEPRAPVEVLDQPAEHFDAEHVELGRGPHGHAETRGGELRRKRVERFAGRTPVVARLPGDARAQQREENRQIFRIASDHHVRVGPAELVHARLGSRAEPKYPAAEVLGRFASGPPLEQLRVEFRPGAREARTNHQQRIGAQRRLVCSGEHHARLARDVEIAQQGVRMHVIDDTADLRGKPDGGARAVDVGSQSGDDRQTTRIEQFRRFDRRGAQRRRPAVDPGLDHFRFPRSASVAALSLRRHT